MEVGREVEITAILHKCCEHFFFSSNSFEPRSHFRLKFPYIISIFFYIVEIRVRALFFKNIYVIVGLYVDSWECVCNRGRTYLHACLTGVWNCIKWMNSHTRTHTHTHTYLVSHPDFVDVFPWRTNRFLCAWRWRTCWSFWCCLRAASRKLRE